MVEAVVVASIVVVSAALSVVAMVDDALVLGDVLVVGGASVLAVTTAIVVVVAFSKTFSVVDCDEFFSTVVVGSTVVVAGAVVVEGCFKAVKKKTCLRIMFFMLTSASLSVKQLVHSRCYISKTSAVYPR